MSICVYTDNAGDYSLNRRIR